MMDESDLFAVEAAIGYHFRDRSLLSRALTHSSCKNDLPLSNERLEFLGDAILGMIISEYLFTRFPDLSEGALTKIKSFVVSRAILSGVGKELGLDEHILVGKGFCSRKNLPQSVIANAFEALVAAIYFDGGLERAREFVIEKLFTHIERAREEQNQRNFKSLLQQYAQREMRATPTYRVIREEGPDHVKSFHVVAVIQKKDYCSGTGRTKKEAEQEAAEKTLKYLLSQRATDSA